MDGNNWVIVANKNGVHRWQKVAGGGSSGKARRGTPKSSSGKAKEKCQQLIRSRQRSLAKKMGATHSPSQIYSRARYLVRKAHPSC